MPDQDKSTPIDLSRYTESTRREVYDRVVALVWTSSGPGDHVPTFSPDEVGLVVYFLYGRWFAVWLDLEDDGPSIGERRRELVRVQESPGSPYGIILAEV